MLEVMELANGLLQLFVRAYAAVIYAFVRRDFGKRYYGIVEFSGAVLPTLLFMTIAPASGRTFLPMLGNVYVLLALVHRFNAAPLMNDRGIHSRYMGTPRIAKWLPFRDAVIREFVEPIFVMAMGFTLIFVDGGIGLFFMVGGFAMMLNYRFAMDEIEGRAGQIVDAELEDELMAEVLERARSRRF